MWVPARLPNWDPYGDKMGQLLTWPADMEPYGSHMGPTSRPPCGLHVGLEMVSMWVPYGRIRWGRATKPTLNTHKQPILDPSRSHMGVLARMYIVLLGRAHVGPSKVTQLGPIWSQSCMEIFERSAKMWDKPTGTQTKPTYEPTYSPSPPLSISPTRSPSGAHLEPTNAPTCSPGPAVPSSPTRSPCGPQWGWLAGKVS